MKNKTFRFAFVVFSSLLFVLSTLQPAFAADPTNIVATDQETDGVNGFTVLDGADDVETFTISGSTYAIVVSFSNSGVQIINISDPSNIVAVTNATDGVNGFTELAGADDVDIFTISGSTYAIVVSQTDDGVQIINISDPSNIVAMDAETDAGVLELDGARGVETFTIGASTYAIIAAFVDNGVQIYNISDPSNIVATDQETDAGVLELSGARGVDAFTIGASTYAIVAAQSDNGVQIYNISDPSNIVATDQETDAGVLEIAGATGVDAFTLGGTTYAIVVSQTDNGVQMFNISDPADILAVDNEEDGVNGFTKLSGARGVDTFTISNSTYAIVVSTVTDHGVQMINVTSPADILAVDSETDGVNGYNILQGASGVDTFTISGSTYAIVAGFTDDGVTIIELNTSSISASSGSGSSSGANDDTGDNTPPTLGVDFNSKRLVTDGFSYNANPVNVQLFYTPYPLITTNVGNNNTAEFKIYENSGPDKIRHLDFAFGLAKSQILADSKVRIEWDKAWNGEETVTLIDPNNVLQNVTVSSHIINCQDTSSDPCLLLVIYHTFRAPLEFNIVATNVWDEKRNAWQNYYNHGIEIVGQSLNPPKKYDAIHKGHIYRITETGKNTAVDDDGNSWTFDKIWNRDYIKPQKLDNELNPQKLLAIQYLGHTSPNGELIFGVDRLDHHFANEKEEQRIIAQNIMSELCSKCSDKSFDKIDDIFSYNFSNTSLRKLDDPEIQKNMTFESDRAQKTMDALLDARNSRE